jgi:hypothetical protein
MAFRDCSICVIPWSEDRVIKGVSDDSMGDYRMGTKGEREGVMTAKRGREGRELE